MPIVVVGISDLGCMINAPELCTGPFRTMVSVFIVIAPVSKAPPTDVLVSILSVLVAVISISADPVDSIFAPVVEEVSTKIPAPEPKPMPVTSIFALALVIKELSVMKTPVLSPEVAVPETVIVPVEVELIPPLKVEK